MKKLLLTTAIVGSALAGFAQKKALTIPQNFLEHCQDASESTNGGFLDTEAVARPDQEPAQNLQATRGGVLWSEDFGNGFPAGWAVDDASGINPWKWSLNGSHGNFNGTNASDYSDPINSTTASNGFLINDPDSANHFNYGQPSGTTYQYLESYFATNAIDLGASYSSLQLEFEQSFRFNNSVDMIVQVSADSSTWVDYTVQGDVDNNTASDNPDLVSINISGAVGNSQTVYLRIGWSARVYFWMIDDMRIVEGLENDLAVTKLYHGDIINAWEYHNTPLAQATEIILGVHTLNNAGAVQNNAVYTYDISDANGSVDSGTFPATNTAIASFETDTTWYSTGFTPSATGNYTVTVSVASDATDEAPEDNEASVDFAITDNIYSHDDEDAIELQIYGGLNANDEPNEYKTGMYYQLLTDATLTAVQVAFGQNTTTSSCIVDVYDANDLEAPLATEVYDLESGDISTGANANLVNILIDDGDGIDLTAGVYFISIGNTGVGEDLWILAEDDGDEDNGTLQYGPFGQGGAVDWYTGYNYSPMVRANFDPTVDVAENEAVSGVSIYPNPANDDLMVNFVSKENQDLTIKVISSTGALVAAEQVTTKAGQSNRVNFNVADLASGIYMVQIQGAASTLTNRVVVQ